MSSPPHPPKESGYFVHLEVCPHLEALATRFLNMLEPLMSKLTDAVAALEKSIDDAVARDQATVADLNKQIADLQAKLAAGGLSAAEEDALAERLAAAQAKADALDPTKSDTLPPDTGTPTGGTPVPSSVAP